MRRGVSGGVSDEITCSDAAIFVGYSYGHPPDAGAMRMEFGDCTPFLDVGVKFGYGQQG